MLFQIHNIHHVNILKVKYIYIYGRSSQIVSEELPCDDILLLIHTDRFDVMGRGHKRTLPDFIGEELRSSGHIKKSHYNVFYGYMRLPMFVDIESIIFNVKNANQVIIQIPTKGSII